MGEETSPPKLERNWLLICLNLKKMLKSIIDQQAWRNKVIGELVIERMLAKYYDRVIRGVLVKYWEDMKHWIDLSDF